MAQNKKNITPENITEWLSSTGFLFPRNEVEDARFEKLYDDIEATLGYTIDPKKIINNEMPSKSLKKVAIDNSQFTEFKMAARNGKNLPKHIIEKIMKNQNNKDDVNRIPED